MEPEKPKNIHHISYIVTDQGNGGWYCSCGASGDGYLAFKCPNCGTENTGGTYINQGGSDF